MGWRRAGGASDLSAEKLLNKVKHFETKVNQVNRVNQVNQDGILIHAFGAWCTHSRFGVKRHLCLFGCGHHTDQVAHSSSCPAFWRILCGIVGFDMPLIDIDAILLLHSSWIGSSNDIRAFVLLGTHICFITNSCRHGMPISRRLVTHNLYNYTRTHYKVTKLLRRVRYHMRNA